MNTTKPIVGLIFIIGLALVTGGAGYYTYFLPQKSTCVAPLQPITLNATAYQWGFKINETDATKYGYHFCHGTTVTFIVNGTWLHDPVNGVNYTQHGFMIDGIMNSPAIINKGVITRVTVTFAVPGVYRLHCTVFCGELSGVGGHSSMFAQITVD